MSDYEHYKAAMDDRERALAQRNAAREELSALRQMVQSYLNAVSTYMDTARDPNQLALNGDAITGWLEHDLEALRAAVAPDGGADAPAAGKEQE